MYFFFRTIQYKHKFLSKNRFDNYYIDNRFKLLDVKKQRLNQESLLPLRQNEKKKYIEVK